MSITPGGHGHPSLGSPRGSRGTVMECGMASAGVPGSPGDELIALTPDGLDQVEAELGADPP
ncbi:MAG: hypothetical protein ACRDP7_42360, partial [Trebonia sp.]